MSSPNICLKEIKQKQITKKQLEPSPALFFFSLSSLCRSYNTTSMPIVKSIDSRARLSKFEFWVLLLTNCVILGKLMRMILCT